jgi:2-polyprenyl-6-methoxyphenol hydroxylase-like FAD-dependent oxidoreductase
MRQSRPRHLALGEPNANSSVMNAPSVLISGAGIAGPALAFWLKAAGFQPTLVEHAPALRTGGYVIDFWGLGYDVAQHMGLVSEIDCIGYHVREMRIVNARGDRIAGFGVNVLRKLTGGRFVTVGRSDLSRLLFEKIKNDTEVIFGDEVVGLQQQPECVQVGFKHGKQRQFDLVIGADGLHSTVRRLVFGSQDRFEKQLGYIVAAFEVSGYRPRDDEVYVMYCEPRRMLGRFALSGNRTLFLFLFAIDTDARSEILHPAAQKAILRTSFGDLPWETPRILAELDRAEDLYFDRVSQIKMPTWSRGRVALVGDAAFCVSLMAGQGGALAMTAAYVLAGELGKMGQQHEEAFRNYERILRTFIESKQRGAARFASAFVPKTHWGLYLRNQLVKAATIPGVARVSFGRDIIDTLQLPDYRRLATLPSGLPGSKLLS